MIDATTNGRLGVGSTPGVVPTRSVRLAEFCKSTRFETGRSYQSEDACDLPVATSRCLWTKPITDFLWPAVLRLAWRCSIPIPGHMLAALPCVQDSDELFSTPSSLGVCTAGYSGKGGKKGFAVAISRFPPAPIMVLKCGYTRCRIDIRD